jgi:ElaB/YqjD/DUF883 family membrane-anchored ribosome-binding protein
MTAAINVKKGSVYAHLNGQSFPIVELNQNLVCLDINGTKTDFTKNEVIISDDNTFSHLNDAQLLHELEFLFYEDGRIGRGHAKAVKSALEEALIEMRKRGYTEFSDLKKAVKKAENKDDLVEAETEGLVTFYERWFNWRSHMSSLGSFETAILEAYRLAGDKNKERLQCAFPALFVSKIYENKP